MAYKNKYNPKREGNTRAPGRRKQPNKEEEDGRSVNKLKKRIRDLERQLNRDQTGVAANVKIERERELDAARDELVHAQNLAQRSRMISKYHMVRFFERKKAARFLKKAKQKLEAAATNEEGEEKREQRELEVHSFEVDLNYTMYYPLEKTYVSLYADEKDRSLQQGGDPEMRAAIEEAMRHGTLQKLRNMALITGGSSKAETSSKKSHRPLSASTQERQGVDMVAVEKEPGDNEDGAGFFE